MRKSTRKTSRPNLSKNLSNIREPLYNSLNHHSKILVSRVSKTLRRNFAPAPKNKIKFEAMTSIKQLVNSQSKFSSRKLTKNREEKILSQMQTHTANTVVNAFTKIQNSPWYIKDVYNNKEDTLARQYEDIGNDKMKSFSIMLASGGLPNLLTLFLRHNGITHVGLTALANAITPDKNGKGALASLRRLELQQNSIGDVGLRALANACAKGALPNLRYLRLDANQINSKGLKDFASACAKGALPKLQNLWLVDNKIGNVGLTALAKACASGALAQLTSLDLERNQIGDPGMSALADACAKGALASLNVLDLRWNAIGDAGLASLADACARGALPNLLKLFVGLSHPALEAVCQSRKIDLR